MPRKPSRRKSGARTGGKKIQRGKKVRRKHPGPARKKPSPARAAKSRPPRARPAAAAPAGLVPHVAWFSFQTPGKPPRRGSFQILLQAENAEQALERCRARLSAITSETRLFASKTTIYLEGVVELRGAYAHGVLVNYESLEQPEIDVRLTCLLPDQLGHGVLGHGPTIEDADAVEPFLELVKSGDDFGAGTEPAPRVRQSSRPPLTARSRAEAS
jgi:hypothetical protein